MDNLHGQKLLVQVFDEDPGKDEAVADAFFQSQNVQAMNDFVRVFGNNPEAVVNMQNAILDRLINESLNTKTGLLDMDQFKRFMTKYDTSLAKLGEVSPEFLETLNNTPKALTEITARLATLEKRKTFLEGEKLKDTENDFKQRLGDIITEEHAAALIGKNNVKNLVQKSGVKESLMSAIEIANNIRTNESLNDLEHNKQFYDDKGEPKFVTSKGTQNPDDYSITFRTKRTAGRTGGGCQLSFTGDGEPAPTQLTDDGQAINTETGEIRQP